MPTPLVNDKIEAYAEQHTSALPALLDELIAATQRDLKERAGMLSGPAVGTLLQTLVFATRAKRVLEVGMFTGFSALMMASALPDDGTLITCDINPRTAEMARGFFDRSPHGRKIEVRLGLALDTLKTLRPGFDLVFIDADKGNYLNYYEAALPLLSPHGLIAVDNVLWSGEVLDPRTDDGHAIVAFNHHVRNDPRVVCVMLTVRDGVTLIRRA
ncbi:MAG TPA: O-methyltransferase [Dehalococcoidia bacterium]|nr:O-methyltransferase [Dehalococcoidia bacterium]